jgi:hypothetical protein
LQQRDVKPVDQATPPSTLERSPHDTLSGTKHKSDRKPAVCPTDEEKRERIEHAQKLIGQGVLDQDISKRLMAKYNVVRRTADSYLSRAYAGLAKVSARTKIETRQAKISAFCESIMATQLIMRDGEGNVINTGVTVRDKLWAAERYCKLHGLDAPERHELKVEVSQPLITVVVSDRKELRALQSSVPAMNVIDGTARIGIEDKSSKEHGASAVDNMADESDDDARDESETVIDAEFERIDEADSENDAESEAEGAVRGNGSKELAARSEFSGSEYEAGDGLSVISDGVITDSVNTFNDPGCAD